MFSFKNRKCLKLLKFLTVGDAAGKNDMGCRDTKKDPTFLLTKTTNKNLFSYNESKRLIQSSSL